MQLLREGRSAHGMGRFPGGANRSQLGKILNPATVCLTRIAYTVLVANYRL